MKLRARANQFRSSLGAAYAGLATRMFSSFSGALAGFHTEVTGTNAKISFADPACCLALKIKGSDAYLYCGSMAGGSTTPYRVLVDSATAYGSYQTPAIPSGADPGRKMTLFTGLADDWHTVFIWRNQSAGSQWIFSNQPAVEAFGVNAEVLPLGVIYGTTDASFPGIYTSPRVEQATIPTTKPSSMVGWGNQNTGSIHFRAKFDEIYVLTKQRCVMASRAGGAMTRYNLAASDADVGSMLSAIWRKVAIPACSTLTDIIISGGAGSTSMADGFGNANEIYAVMLTGSGAQMAAPATKRHLCMIGASQSQGNGSATAGNSAETDVHMMQDRVPVYSLNVALAGGTITNCIAAMPTVLPTIPYKDICLLSIGTNSADDAAFVGDYKTLIQAMLTGGFQKVICETICSANPSYLGQRNAKIAQAVSETNDPRVVLADATAWPMTTDGANDSMAAPDGLHYSAAGYAKKADFRVRDHYSLFI